MKLKNLLQLIFLASFVLVTACKKDEPENYITYDGKTYEIGQVFLMHVNNGSNCVYAFSILSSGLTYDSKNNIWTGSGEELFLILYSSSPYDVTGTYSSFNGTLFHNYNPSTNTKTGVMIKSGTIDVVDKGSFNYSIDVNAKTLDNKPITAHYDGVAQEG